MDIDELKDKVLQHFKDNSPPFIWPENETETFPGLQTIPLNDAIREVWRSARDQMIDLIEESR